MDAWGAMIFGDPAKEHVQLNEDTLWSGPGPDWNNPDAKNHIAEVRRLVLQEKDYGAADKACQKMQGAYTEAYEPLGDLFIALRERVSGGRIPSRTGPGHGHSIGALHSRRR